MQLAGPDLDARAPSPPGCSAPRRPAAARRRRSTPTATRARRRCPSYSSPADYTFLWYDATAKGPDEEGTNGTGLMRYVNGGARYKAGTVPSGPVPDVHDGRARSRATPRRPTGLRPTRPGRARPRRRIRLTPGPSTGASPRHRTPGSGILHRGARRLMLEAGGAERPGPVAEGAPMIVTHGLTKRYGKTLAVDDLSFTVSPGVVTGFLGPNGSGKSTTMRMILGLDRPDAGPAARQRLRLRRAVAGRCARSAPCSTPRPSTRAAAPATTCAGWPRPTTSRGRGSTRCSTSSGSPRSPTSGPASSRSAWDSGSASPAPSSATPACCSSTSRSTASTPRASAGSATCCGTWPPRAGPCSSRATSSTRWP